MLQTTALGLRYDQMSSRYIYGRITISDLGRSLRTWIKQWKKKSMVLVREWTTPTQRPPLVGEVSTNFCGWNVSRGQRNGSPRPYSRIYRPKPLLFLITRYSTVLTRLSGLRSSPTTFQKIWWFTLWPWRWRQYIPPTSRLPSTVLYAVIPQKIKPFLCSVGWEWAHLARGPQVGPLYQLPIVHV
jgi:hypothetical protein